MRMGSNRRLANVKTRSETGLDYVMQSLSLCTPFGRAELKNLKPYFPGDEDELRSELDRVESTIEFVKANKPLVEKIRENFAESKDLSTTVKRASNSTLSVVEVYEVKALILMMERFTKLTKGKISERYELSDTTGLLDTLDPRHDRINTFYVYDEFSMLLGALRQKKRAAEVSIRKEQKEKREEIRKIYGVQLTPKFDIVISKSHKDIEKVKSIQDLELTDEDYMSMTFKLKPNDKVFDLMKEIENLNTEIEEEEERILRDLSSKIASYSDVINSNCERIGEFDLALSKALYAIDHDCVKPEIVDEHIIEIEEGRNLWVEDVLHKKGKKYCPVSILLRDGVTCITGANMGGKTISLKLSGQVPILAQYGFFVGAKSARIGLSNYMQILIGDSQSVERGLSSFGSEMEELKEILDNSVDRSVVLIDEIASGTNPIEGLALTKSVVDYIIEKPYITLITTHFETVTEREGVVNMQVRGLSGVDFTLLNREIQYAKRRDRINIISKYMDYRLYRVEKQGEVPKDALNIAKMLGIDAEIIEGAKKYIK